MAWTRARRRSRRTPAHLQHLALEAGSYSEYRQRPEIGALGRRYGRGGIGVGMTVVIMAYGHRDVCVSKNLRRMMFVVVPLMSHGVADIPQTGQGPNGNEQHRTLPGRPKPARRRHCDALFSLRHCHSRSLTSNTPSLRRPTHRRHQAALESPFGRGQSHAREYDLREPAPLAR